MFTINYTSLFKHSEDRCYRVEVLEKGLEQHPFIWVNGARFQFSWNVQMGARALAAAWGELIMFLDGWPSSCHPARETHRSCGHTNHKIHGGGWKSWGPLLRWAPPAASRSRNSAPFLGPFSFTSAKQLLCVVVRATVYVTKLRTRQNVM